MIDQQKTLHPNITQCCVALKSMLNRPGVAGAVLTTPLSYFKRSGVFHGGSVIHMSDVIHMGHVFHAAPILHANNNSQTSHIFYDGQVLGVVKNLYWSCILCGSCLTDPV